MQPTQEAYTELQTAYDHFNRHLFDGALPPCLITLQRKKRTYGYFSSKRFVNRHGVMTDEIAMNPEFFSLPITETLQTLVHEMAHLWQAHCGDPGRGRYHNQEWASKMESMGLMPSNTGKPGGAKTGDQMMDYPIEGGRFEVVAGQLITESFTVSWVDRFKATEAAPGGTDGGEGGAGVKVDKSNRLKYHCPSCRAQVWGKPGLKVRCGECLSEPLFEVWGASV
jgi:predicted SprT family Zn-dependent metalloprotease